jgi:outer membrane lipoprotein-sorting protein
MDVIRVLVADDHPPIRFALRCLLEKPAKNFTVAEATNAITTWRRWWRAISVKLVAVSLLILISGTMVLVIMRLSNQQTQMNARDILERAKQNMFSGERSEVSSFRLTRVITNYYSHAETREVQHVWFRQPSYWRFEGNVSMTPSSTNDHTQYITVADGDSIWLYDSKQQLVQIHSGTLNDLSSNPSLTSSIEKAIPLLLQVDSCRIVRLQGEQRILERATYVIEIDSTTCPRSNSASIDGAQRVWIDKATFFVLKMEIFSADRSRIVHISEVIDIDYNIPTDSSTFHFRFPSNVKIIDYHNRSSTTKRDSTDAVITPLPTNGTSIEEIRQLVSFELFVPAYLSDNLIANEPTLERLENGEVRVSIEYTHPLGKRVLHVINGPAGCCLDADPRKLQNPVNLATGFTAYFINLESRYGGPILWWQQGKTYIALSGPEQTKETLVTIAQSMSPEASLK